MSWLRRALASACDGSQKDIAAAAFPAMKAQAGVAELGKYLSGERGESALRVIETVFKLGDRQVLREALEAQLKEQSPEVQLSLLLPTIRTLAKRTEEVLEEIERVGAARGKR